MNRYELTIDPRQIPEQVTRLITELVEAGYPTYLVGGSLRDLLSGRPAHDFDLATAALPEEVRRVLSAYAIYPTGLKHGTVTVVANNLPVEVTTFRSEGTYTDRRRPDEVRFERTFAADAARRDFTINAIAYNQYEGLLDPTGGYDDLRSGVIRAVGDPRQRFAEDALRILRGLRLAAELDFTIEAETMAAILEAGSTLSCISAERKAQEFRRFLVCEPRVLRRLWPESRSVWGEVLTPIGAVSPEWWESITAAFAEIGGDFIARLAVLLISIGISSDAEDAATLRRQLILSNNEWLWLKSLLEAHNEEYPASRYELKLLVAEYGYELLREWMRIEAAMVAAFGGSGRSRTEEQPAWEELSRRLDELEEAGECCTAAQLELTGLDLIELGMKPGEALGQCLKEALEAVMREEIPNEKSALRRWAKERCRGLC